MSLAKFDYHSFGRRVRKIEGSTTTYYSYDGDRVYAEYETDDIRSAHVLTRYYVDGPLYVDGHVLMNEGGDGGNDFYYLLGSLHSVVGLVDAAGTVVASYTYDGFGRPSEAAPAPPEAFAAGSRFIGVTLPATTEAFAIRVESLRDEDVASGYGGGGGAVYADAPFEVDTPWAVNTPETHWHSLVCQESAAYLTPAQWSGDGVVYLTGTHILPATTYRVSFETPNGLQSSPAIVTTLLYGDTNRDGAVNAQDIAATVDAIKPVVPPETAIRHGLCLGWSGIFALLRCLFGVIEAVRPA